MKYFSEWFTDHNVNTLVVRLIENKVDDLSIPISYDRFKEMHHFYLFKMLKRTVDFTPIIKDQYMKKKFFSKDRKYYLMHWRDEFALFEQHYFATEKGH